MNSKMLRLHLSAFAVMMMCHVDIDERETKRGGKEGEFVNRAKVKTANTWGSKN